MALEQRLNFWVSQETYDFYARLAIRRKQKVSELLRVILDRATCLVDEDGKFRDSVPMSRDDLVAMMRKVAAEEAAKAVGGAEASPPPSLAGRPVMSKPPTVAEAAMEYPVRSPGPVPGETAAGIARTAAENTRERGKARRKAAGAVDHAAPKA